MARISAIVPDSFLALPISISTSSVLASINLKISSDLPYENMVFSVKTYINISPVATDTILKDRVTLSSLYITEELTPSQRAPAPPLVRLVS